MVWYGAGIRKLGDGMITGGGTEIKVSIPSHPIPIPFRWEYHPNILPRKALIISGKLGCLFLPIMGVVCGSKQCTEEYDLGLKPT